MENFDEKALTWDSDPRRIERARAVAAEIKSFVPCLKSMGGMEYGCGTGLLSFELQPFLKSIVMADNSEGMLKVLEEKIKNSDICNMSPRYADLTQTGMQESFDIIYTLMSLHHIVDIEKIIMAFNKLLNSSGYLCIADLVEEDGSFHGKGFVGHKGFNKDILTGILGKYGFKTVRWKLCYDNIKKYDDGSEKIFPLFLLIAQKEG